MIGIPSVVILKDRPLERGHRLYATAPAGRRKKDQTCAVHCSCGQRLAVSVSDQYQAALDLAARNHRRTITAPEEPMSVPVHRNGNGTIHHDDDHPACLLCDRPLSDRVLVCPQCAHDHGWTET